VLVSALSIILYNVPRFLEHRLDFYSEVIAVEKLDFPEMCEHFSGYPQLFTNTDRPARCWSHQRSCSTSSPVSSGMGDLVRVRLRRRIFITVFNQPPRSTQPVHPSVSRRNEYWICSFGHYREENGEFCVTVGPANQNCWCSAIVDQRRCLLTEPAIRPTWVVCWLN